MFSSKVHENNNDVCGMVGVEEERNHAVHSTAWWSRSEGLWKGPVYPFSADKFPMITDQHTAGGSVSQLSQMAKLSS